MQFTNDEKEIIKNITEVYLLNRKYFIKAEEYIDGLKFFITPVLEHRDALDHLARAFDLALSEKDCLDQLKNAQNHELRAFFDISDYICIKMREKIGLDLKRLSKAKIKKIWNDYEEVKIKVVELSKELADIRINRNNAIESVPKYVHLLDVHLDYYINTYKKKIEPKIYGRILSK